MGNTVAKKYKIRFPSYSGSQPNFTPEIFQQKGIEYAEFCMETGRVPRVTGFALFCGVSHETLQYYERKGEEFRTVIQFVKDWIKDEKYQQGLAGMVNAKILTIDLVNENRQINSRSVNDNKNENTGSVKVTEIRRVVVDPKKRDAKAELEALKKAHQEQEAARGTAEESKQGDVASPRQGSKRTVKTRTKRTKTVKTRKKKGKGQASSEEQ